MLNPPLVTNILSGLKLVLCKDDIEIDTRFGDKYDISDDASRSEVEKVTATTTTPASTTTAQDSMKSLVELRAINNKLTDVRDMSQWFLEDDYKLRIDVARCLVDLTSPKGLYFEEMMAMIRDPNEPGWHATRERLTDYLDYVGTRSVKPKGDSVFVKNSFTLDETIFSHNYAAEVRKLSAMLYRKQGAGKSYFTFPDQSTTNRKGAWQRLFKKWQGNGPIVEKMSVPTTLFTGKCETKPVTFVGEIYDEFADSGRANPVFVQADDVVLDSRIMSVSVSACENSEAVDLIGRPAFTFGKRCQPDWQLLVRYPVHFTFAILSQRHDFGRRRKLLSYFDSVQTSKISRRHCVRWNPELGAWDTAGVRTHSANSTVAHCSSPHMGAFAIIAELADDPWVQTDSQVLMSAKLVLYGVSIICLLFLILFICFRKTMWDMFHMLTMNFGVCLLITDVFMMVAELESVRTDRETCCAVGLFINFFAVSTASHLLCECLAMHRAYTAGVVAGYTKMYLSFGWSLPFLAIGYNVNANLSLMGDDPRCMIGWFDEPKWTFFVPMLFLCGLSFVVCAIVLANMCTPHMKDAKVEQEVRDGIHQYFYNFSIFFLSFF
jgi:hypothetical protein